MPSEMAGGVAMTISPMGFSQSRSYLGPVYAAKMPLSSLLAYNLPFAAIGGHGIFAHCTHSHSD